VFSLTSKRAEDLPHFFDTKIKAPAIRAKIPKTISPVFMSIPFRSLLELSGAAVVALIDCVVIGLLLGLLTKV
jgi:hypothetical protein